MRVFVHIALAVTLLTACQKAEERSVLAKINNDTIGADEFKTRLSEYRVGVTPLMGPTPEEIALKKKILNEMIEEHVLMSEAQKMSIDVSQDQLEDALQKFVRDYPQNTFDERLKEQKISRARFKDRLRSNLIIQKLVEKVTMNVPSPAPEEIEKYYKDHIEQYQSREQFHLRQIVVKSEEDAKALLEQLKKGTAFEELAQNHSFTADAAQGGDLGFVTLGVMPKEVDAELPKLAVGKLSGVISTEYGFHILKLIEKKADRLSSLEEATPKIIQTLTQRDREQKFEDWRKDVLSKAKIERNHALLASIH